MTDNEELIEQAIEKARQFQAARGGATGALFANLAKALAAAQTRHIELSEVLFNSAVREQAAMDENERLRDALEKADKELARFADDAVCDHDVGVCWCIYHDTRGAIRAALASKETDDD